MMRDSMGVSVARVRYSTVILGGVIPSEDVEELKGFGVSMVFTPGTLKEAIIEGIKNLFYSTD